MQRHKTHGRALRSAARACRADARGATGPQRKNMYTDHKMYEPRQGRAQGHGNSEGMPDDFQKITVLVKAAFDSAEHADGNEQDLVNALRLGGAYIPELALVAEIAGEIAGHIMFTRLKIGESVQLALAPLSVLPAYQGQGIGAALVRAGHEKARALGYAYFRCFGQRNVLFSIWLSARKGVWDFPTL